jgi:hypothetical protein
VNRLFGFRSVVTHLSLAAILFLVAGCSHYSEEYCSNIISILQDELESIVTPEYLVAQGKLSTGCNYGYFSVGKQFEVNSNVSYEEIRALFDSSLTQAGWTRYSEKQLFDNTPTENSREDKQLYYSKKGMTAFVQYTLPNRRVYFSMRFKESS